MKQELTGDAGVPVGEKRRRRIENEENEPFYIEV